MMKRVVAVAFVGVMAILLAGASCSAAVELTAEQARSVRGGCSYMECISYGFCNAWPTGVPDGYRCTPTCSASGDMHRCDGDPSHDYCVTQYYGGQCGYRYSSGISRDGECKPDIYSMLTEQPCHRQYCDLTP